VERVVLVEREDDSGLLVGEAQAAVDVDEQAVSEELEVGPVRQGEEGVGVDHDVLEALI
jgi:hypothetical protein